MWASGRVPSSRLPGRLLWGRRDIPFCHAARRPARLSPRPPFPVVAPECPPCVARSLPCASLASGSSWAWPSKRKPAHSGEGSLGLYGKGRQEKREEDGPAVDAGSTPSSTDGVRSPKVAQPVRGRPGVPIAAPRPVAHIFATSSSCSPAQLQTPRAGCVPAELDRSAQELVESGD